jgi:Ser/Thr protein kinase RdoA (MazF antagonist)
MKLFQPNNLSLLKPEFIPVADTELIDAVRSLLDQYGVSARQLAVSSAAGANVTSQNLRVQTNGKSYFLKRRRLDHLTKIEDEARLTAMLAEHGAKAPRIISNGNKRSVSVAGESCCVLYEFVEGTYFSGSGGELDSAAEAFAELSKIAIESRIFSEQPVSTPLNQLEDLLTKSQLASDIQVAQLIETHAASILRVFEHVQAYRARIEATVVPLHLDFHPLNLLMKDERVECVLDFEHLKPYPVMAGVGFAGLKLIRQTLTAVEKRGTASSLVRQWVDMWSRSFPNLPVSPEEFRLGASYRVLVLISFILDSWLSKGDARFNYDLEKQITSLYEIEALGAI